MKLLRMLSLTLVAAAFGAEGAAAQLRLDLNVPTSRLVVYDGDEMIRSYPISVGKADYPTPTGSFEITHADWNPDWRPPQREWTRGREYTPPGPNNPMGRVKLFFLPLYFIHGSPEAESIGTPASHGCVRMLNADAIELSRLIHEHVAPQISEAQIDGILRNSRTTRRVNFREGVPVEIRYDPIVVEGDRIMVFPDLYNRQAIHGEAVYQALLRAGYDVQGLDSSAIQAFLESARGRNTVYQARLDEVFGTSLARAS